jgi:hypothetical protein
MTRSKIRKKNFDEFNKVQELAKSHNPLPKRNRKNVRLRSTIELHSGFMNARQRYFNVGKYKGVDFKHVPLWYMKWVVDTIRLNEAELQLVRKYIKHKGKNVIK